MATPSGREPVMIDKRAKAIKIARPVKKVQLKTKPTVLAKEIKKTTERKGAVVKKESQKRPKKEQDTTPQTDWSRWTPEKKAKGPKGDKGSKGSKGVKGTKGSKKTFIR